MAIAKGRQRGLKVYAWLYSLSFGKNYEQTPDGIEGLAANGRGQTTSFPGDEGYLPSSAEDRLGTPVVFVDPHSESVRRDYNQMVAAIAKRKPDGILFDYIRFPKGRNAQSIVGDVRDLWIYNPETRRKLEALAQNEKGGELIRRYLQKGNITIQDLNEVDAQYPGELPRWVTRRPLDNEANMSAADRLPWIQWDLWQLAVGYAAQGVVDFFRQASNTAQLAGVSTSGAVFFPEGNQALGNRGYDSRLQPWHQFPRDRQWHPMVYGICGTSDCIEKQVQRVVNSAPTGTIVMPVLAGIWGQALQNRPSLEVQMAGIHRTSPQITSMSHFAYSWQEPESDLFRSQCRL
jgi:hypothetical protein